MGGRFITPLQKPKSSPFFYIPLLLLLLLCYCCFPNRLLVFIIRCRYFPPSFFFFLPSDSSITSCEYQNVKPFEKDDMVEKKESRPKSRQVGQQIFSSRLFLTFSGTRTGNSFSFSPSKEERKKKKKKKTN